MDSEHFQAMAPVVSGLQPGASRLNEMLVRCQQGVQQPTTADRIGPPLNPTPCLRCGACCACFQVTFPASECDLTEVGIVPVAYTVSISPHRRAMRGTDKWFNKRCVALTGVIGVSVRCAIYALRPSACHLFRMAWGTDSCTPNRNCDRARAAYGLSPFSQF